MAESPLIWRLPPVIQASVGLHAAALGLLALNPAWWPVLAAAVATNHLALTAVGLWPRSQAFGETIFRLSRSSASVALTFDDGPNPAVTPHVLDVLDRFGATASFFCIGERARAHPALVRQIAAAGHSVENHTLTHPNAFACYGPRALRREVLGAQAILSDITGQAPSWFRAPMGFRSPLLQPVLAEAGLRQAAWIRRGFDTRCRDPKIVLRRLTRKLAGGDVLLLHDGHPACTADGQPVVLQVLSPVLTAMAERGLSAAALPARAEPAGAAGSRP